MKTTKATLAGLAIALLASAAAHANTIVFSDDTFNLSQYSETPIARSAPGGSVSYSQCPTCGNPGSALQVNSTAPGGGDAIGMGFINNSFSYDPATRGSITSINFAIDKNYMTQWPVSLSHHFSNAVLALIEQNGSYFIAPVQGPHFNGGTTGYKTLSVSGLLATSFSEIDFATNKVLPVHPNFSGADMLFGFASYDHGNKSFPNDLSFVSDFDNLNLTISAQAKATPDSANTAALLGLAVGVLSLVRRRTAV
ncbi:MAG: hypothetical protein JO354_06595 [Verrucomicrobia bacterium]|nr:hypothetical protein [Verrucomicrobiota bacterium]